MVATMTRVGLGMVILPLVVAFVPPSTKYGRPSYVTLPVVSRGTRSLGMSSSPDDASATGTPESVLTMEGGSQEELMYTLGVNLARQLGDVRPLVESADELTLVAKGLLDAFVGLLDDNAQRALLASRGDDLRAMIGTRAENMRMQVEETGKAMLKQMSETEGTETLPCGVVVHVLEDGPDGKGQGTRPTAASSIKVHYHGTLPDGTVFDSTLNGEPATFALAQVVPGWKEGMLKLHEGETAMLGIPPNMAYGADGIPDGSIPGGATIFFKVQLLEVLSAGIGGGPSLLGADGNKISSKTQNAGSGLLGANGQPL
eukprot:scaffold36293_cov48-Attheya_sp.AAC.2